MKKIFWSLMILGVLVSSCRRNSSETDGDGDGGEVISRNLSNEEESFKESFDGFMDAFRGKDISKLNDFIGDDGVYVIFSPRMGGAYNDFLEFKDMDELTSSKDLEESLTYFEQALNSGQVENGGIIYEDLDKVDPCDYNEMKVSADYGTTNILTTTVKALENQTGEGMDEAYLKEIKALEDKVKIKVYVGVGEEAEVMYFTKAGDDWKIAILDLSECGG